MKKLILEVIALVVTLIITISLIYGIDRPYRVKRIKELKGDLEIINLGTSHGWNFSYAKSPLKGINFNVSGNSLYYDLQNYRFLHEKGYLAKNAIIAIPVSYFAFGLDENRTDGYVSDAFVNQFYDYLPPRYIHDYSIKKELELAVDKAQKNLNLRNKGRKRRNQKARKNTTIANKEQDKGQEEISRDSMNTRLEKIASARVKRHIMLGNLNSPGSNETYFESLIREILSAGDHPILVTTPYYCAYNNGFDQEWLEQEYFSRMRSLASEYNLLYLDYSHDERFSNSPELFKDSDHLNETGRALFNKIFFEDISEIIASRKTIP